MSSCWVLLFLFGLRGYVKGFFREIFSLAGLIIGFMAAARYNHTVATLGEEYWKISPFILKGASFVGIFLSSILCSICWVGFFIVPKSFFFYRH